MQNSIPLAITVIMNHLTKYKTEVNCSFVTAEEIANDIGDNINMERDPDLSACLYECCPLNLN